jgi:hypothetical protein
MAASPIVSTTLSTDPEKYDRRNGCIDFWIVAQCEKPWVVWGGGLFGLVAQIYRRNLFSVCSFGINNDQPPDQFLLDRYGVAFHSWRRRFNIWPSIDNANVPRARYIGFALQESVHCLI